MKKEMYEKIRMQALAYYDRASIVLTPQEKSLVEAADFGLDNIEKIGLILVTYINTERCCAKEMVLFPGMTCPEHTHAPIPEKDYPGKEETFRCRWGTVYLYVEGEETKERKGKIPEGYEETYTVFHEIILRAGQQYTILPNTKHWFQAGPDGAVISEFSTPSFDEYDIFTDQNVKRLPEIE
ncbi:MAG: D-lyxose/D-mannose family sugar isomerase [Eubacteriales bacterium]|nr:D-lyxose/D-mannose family sugar isomerase [Eubacteriales bacterium]